MKGKILVCLAAFILPAAGIVNSQIIINPAKVLERKAANRVNKAVDKAADQVLDSVTGKKANPPVKKDDKVVTDNKVKNDTAVKVSADAPQPLKAFSNYDFVPGEKVIFFDDFSQDAVGDFPALWTTDAAGEVNTLSIASGHWLNLNSTEGTYWMMKDIAIPKNFILEMDIVPKKKGGRYAVDITLFGEASHSEMDKNGDPGICGLHILVATTGWQTIGYKKGISEKLSGQSGVNLVEPEKVNHVIVWVQNRRVRVYHKGGKVIDIPTNIFDGSEFKRLCFKLYRGASCASYISNVKITDAAPDMRSKLLTEGKIVSYGVYFDVNKDIVKPESYGTLKGIADVLNENPDVKIKIVGHTDTDGADAANLDLSKRRAAAVKAELAKTFGIDASRIQTDGKGESQPVAANDSPANKALNRRVEFIKL